MEEGGEAVSGVVTWFAYGSLQFDECVLYLIDTMRGSRSGTRSEKMHAHMRGEV